VDLDELERLRGAVGGSLRRSSHVAHVELSWQRLPSNLSEQPLVREELHEATYAPRDPLEWQGMLVDLSMQASCESSAQCGLAMSCQHGRCGPCVSDGDCAVGEGCVLDHCLRLGSIACRSFRDCTTGELCALSGYSADPRGNSDMEANCLAASGGRPQDVRQLPFRDVVPSEPTPVRADEMLRELKEATP